MNKKHPMCNWTVYGNDKLPMIETEGKYWIVEAYFNKNKSLLDAEVDFFENIINEHKAFCDENNINYEIPPLIKSNMTFDEFAILVGRAKGTVQKEYYKLSQEEKEKSFQSDNKKYIASSVLTQLCKQSFKRRYLQYLEEVYIYLWQDCLSGGSIYR